MSYCTSNYTMKNLTSYAFLATLAHKGRSVLLVLYNAITIKLYLHSKNDAYKASNIKLVQSNKKT